MAAAPTASCWRTERALRPTSSSLPPAPGRARIAGLPPDRRPPVRPVKGQMFALRMDAAAPLLNHVLWAPGAYLVPRRDGRLIVGATVEEKGFDDKITAGGMLTLLEAAWRAIPAIEELPIDEIWVGHRPGSRDDAPVLGRGPLEGLFYATGHHRNGILLAPVTADTMAKLISTMSSIRRSVRSASSAFCRRAPRSRGLRCRRPSAMIRVNGESEPLGVATLEALLAEKAVDTAQRGIAVALNGAVVPRAAWRDTPLRARRQHRDRARAAGRVNGVHDTCPIH